MRVIRAICFTALAACSVSAQVSGAAQARKRLTHRDVASRGWKTPVFADQASEVKAGKPEVIDGAEAQVKFHQLADEQLVHVEGCKAKDGERAVDKSKWPDLVVRDFKTYEAGGRVFAYYVVYYIVKAKGGYITERFGAAYPVHYVDEDGDGTFELRCRSMKLENLPGWVKTISSKP